MEHDAAGDLAARRSRSWTARWRSAGLTAADLAAIGITNQRETTLVWNRLTGEPYYNAIVWQDTRTDKICNELAKDGRPGSLPGKGRACRWPPISPAPRSSGSWTTSPACGPRPSGATRIFGNMDTWVIWNLTGGAEGGAHVTDVTNASRTMLMDLRTLDWDDEILAIMGIPQAMLPDHPPVQRPGDLRLLEQSRRSAAIWAISRRPRWARPASSRARPRTPTAPAASCS